MAEKANTVRLQRKSVLSRHLNTADRKRIEKDTKGVKKCLSDCSRTFNELEVAYYEYIDCLNADSSVDHTETITKAETWFSSTTKFYTEKIEVLVTWLDQQGHSDLSASFDDAQASAASSSSSGAALPASFSAELAARLSLPAQHVPQFDGKDIRTYKVFKFAFEQAVCKTITDPQEKLTRLTSYLEGEALQSIYSCVLKGGLTGYESALKILDSRYGNTFALSERLISDLKQGKSAHKPADLLRLSDEIATAQQILENSDAYSRLDNPDFITHIVSRCKPSVREKWRKYALKENEDKDRVPNFDDFQKFLKKQAKEAINPLYGEEAFKHAVSNSLGVSGLSRSSHNQGHTSVQSEPKGDRSIRGVCVKCQGSHRLYDCDQFKRMAQPDRYAFVRDNRLCYNCLSLGHGVSACRSTYKCNIEGCGRRHHSLIHRDRASLDSRVGRSQVTTHASRVQVCSALDADEDIICLPLASVRVNGTGPVTVLLDPGSTCTLITKRLANRLELEGNTVPLILQTVHGKKKSETKMVKFDIESLDGKCTHTVKHACVISDIPARTPRAPAEHQKWTHLSDIQLNDIPPGTQADIIIGQDNSDLLVPLEVRSGNPGENRPYAVRTRLGWVLNGIFGRGKCEPGQVFGICNHINIDKDEEIKEKLDNLWSLEKENEQDPSWSQEDRKVYDMWQGSVYLQDGRYVVPIPWKDGRPGLPNNRFVATKRLESTLRKLERTDMFKRYDEGIQKYLDDGHAEYVPEDALGRNDGAVWYLPHHGVYQAEKDKLRIVHDCSALYQGISLNNSCFRGPVLVNRLQSVLLRFRQHAYAWTADVTAMYLQVVIPEEDRDCLRFLWVRDGKIVELRMTRHLFGGVWCSSSSAYALLRTLEDFRPEPQVCDVVSRAMYVDDLLSSQPDPEFMYNLLLGVCKVLIQGGFPLSKHMVNVPAILDRIPEEERAKEARVITDVLKCKTLGIRWDVILDVFRYLRDVIACVTVSKRVMLSQVSSTYDPLGLVIPIVILGRMLFQRAVRMGLGWDDPVPPGLLESWRKWSESLSYLEHLSFPRCLIPSGMEGSVAELHHFCDGSLSAYGVCTYIRLLHGASIVVRLVSAKARLVPLNVLTVPRVELCAAKMAADAEETIRRDLDIELLPSTFWSDSQVVLAYIRCEAGRFKPFVSNRVSSIRSRSLPSQWRYVPTSMNPADILSRGCVPQDLPEVWSTGPEFLSLHRDSWSEFLPETQDLVVTTEDVEVRKAATMAAVTETVKFEHPFDTLTNYVSKYSYLLKLISWWRRTCVPGPDVDLTVEEICRSEEVLVQYVQSRFYGGEIRSLHTGEQVSVRSDIARLDPRLHEGVLVVGGRLSRSSQSFQERHPIILPGSSKVSRLLLKAEHDKAHLGVEWTLSNVRSKFWIPGARGILRGIRRKCVTCQRLYGKSVPQKMSDLPVDRVSVKAAVFDEVGVDLFGPFFVAQGRARVKRWGCVFTCLAVRAVHIEVLSSMDSDSFINAFRRFCARRGIPSKVRSDQGTNFVGALAELRKEFKNIDKKSVVRTARDMNVDWEFNPPYASHQGGVWERMIRTIRKVLVALLPQGSVPEEVLVTTFAEVECMVNGRPITQVSADPEDGVALTPNHLLLLSGNMSPMWRTFLGGEVARRRWKMVQNLAAEFWYRWTREYLPTLQDRQKWLRPGHVYQAGDVVVVLDEQVKSSRGKWPLAKIVEVRPSLDGAVRQVRLQFHGTEVVRPITKIAPLELN